MEAKKIEADGLPFNFTPSRTSSPTHSMRDNGSDQTDRAVPPPIKFNESDMYYNMTGEKRMIIFNHHKYEKPICKKNEKLSDRTGTEHDVKRLKITFQKLGFKTTVFNDLRQWDILTKLREVCKEDHKATSCIAVVILTHGDEDGCLFAADQPYNLKDIINILQNGDAGLVGKPKLMFVQACRGKNKDEGKRIVTDGPETEESILPTHSDMLITLSSAECYVSYRDPDTGTWLIQTLCSIVDMYHRDYDLLQLLTLVNQHVANKPNASETVLNMKMMPETKFTLRKLLRLNKLESTDQLS